MRGRTRLSTEEKKLRGTYEACKEYGGGLKPDVLKNVPEPPAYFTDDEKTAWVSTCGHLVENGVLSTVDHDLIETYARTLVIHRAASAEINRQGILISETKTNGEEKKIQNPAFLVASKAAQILVSISDRFGFTPYARQKIKPTAQPTEKSEFEKLFEASQQPFIPPGKRKKAEA